jgi:outer membrane protein assembly factor BamB
LKLRDDLSPTICGTKRKSLEPQCLKLQGFLYVLDHKGETKEGWPLQMGEIQAQVAVADLYRDGRLTLIASDARGNVAAFDGDGNELWERHLGTLISQVSFFLLVYRGQTKEFTSYSITI